jgi:hypothetical protein
MMLLDDIEALRKRLAKAEVDRDTWRSAGPQDKYLAAYFAVEALELQLDERLREQARPSMDPPV